MEYKIKAMGVGELLDTSIKVFTSNFLLFTLIGGVWILGFLPFIFIRLGGLFLGTGGFNPKNLSVMGMFLPIIILLGVFLMFGLQYLSTAALTKAIGERYLGNPASWGESYKTALSSFFPLMGTLMLAGLIIFVGLLLFIIPGILLALAFYIVPPIVILEKKSGFEALKRAWFLMKGNKGKTFLILLLIGIVSQIAAFVAIFPFIGLILRLGTTIVFFAFGQVAVTLIYFHARCQKEAFDLELLAKELPGAGPS